MSAGRRRWLLVAALVYAAVAALLMRPVLGAPADRVYGLPSDPLGEVWRLEQFRTGEIALVGDSRSGDANAPSGVDVRRAVDATQVVYDVPAWGLVRVLPAVLTYNLLVWTALWTAGLAAFWAMGRLGARWAGAGAAGLLFMLAPAHMLEAQLHVALALVAPLPIALALGIAAVRRPGARAGAVFGAAVAACGYVTAYLGLEAAALACGIAVTAAAAALADRSRARALAGAGGAALAAAAVVVAPLLVVLATSRGALDAAVGRPASDLATFSLEPGDLVARGESGYIGLVAVAAALAGLRWGRGGRALRWGLAAVAVAGAWFSLSPDAAVVGAIAPAPLIHAVVPFWRVYGRVEIVAALGIACLAGLAVARLAERRDALARVAALALVVVAVADVAQAPPGAAADRGRRDPVAEWLAGARGAVAEYPLRSFDDYRLGAYLFRQTRHGRPLMDGTIAGTRSADLSEAAGEPGGAQARAALAIAGVHRVAVGPDGVTPPGLAPGPRFPDGSRGWSVPAGTAAAVALARSALAGEAGPGGAAFHWLSPGAAVRVLTSCAGSATVTLTVVSQGVPRTVRLGGVVRRVATAPTRLRFTVPVDGSLAADLPVVTTPAPAPLPGGDPRVAGVGVYALSATVACRPSARFAG